MFFLLPLCKKFVRSPFWGPCLKYFGSKFTDSYLPGLQGDSLFLSLSFFLCLCKRRFIQIRMFFLLLIFLGSHLWFLLALISHYDSLLLQFFCQISATDTGRFWADGILFFSTLAYLTNPVLIIFHCPLSLHQIHSPPTIQFSIDCLHWLYCITSLNLYLPTNLYYLKFTYLWIATLYLRILLLIPTNCCILIRTTLYLRIYVQ